MLRTLGIFCTAAAIGCQSSNRPWSHVDVDQRHHDAHTASASVEDSTLDLSSDLSVSQQDAEPREVIADRPGTASISAGLSGPSSGKSAANPSQQADSMPTVTLGNSLEAIPMQGTQENVTAGKVAFPEDLAFSSEDEESQDFAFDLQPASFELVPPALDDEEPLSGPQLDRSDTSEGAETENADTVDADTAEIEEAMPFPLLIPEDGTVLDAGSRPDVSGPVELDDVIASVYARYPLLEAAFLSRTIADGQQISAAGEFDLKLKALSENRVLGYYKTFRQHVGFVQPTWQGGEFYGGYRVGQGEFPPWYLERQTNEGGEFKAGYSVPFAQNRHIDPRRGGVMKADINRKLVEPDIQAQLIGFVQEAGYAYWDWVAAGEKYRIAARILVLAEDRTERIRRQVEEGLIDPPELTDNMRLVAERRAKLQEAERKREQTAFKLSLYLRDANGVPVVPPAELAPIFPPLTPQVQEHVHLDMQQALQWRPELDLIDFQRRELQVELELAENELRPYFGGNMEASQDIGAPKSYKNDKGPLELHAGLSFEVPLQRRKAEGKIFQVQGKMAQLTAKRRLVEDKIVAEVGQAAAGVRTAYEQAVQAEQAVDYAEELAQRERRNLELGASDLLKVSLREQYAVEAAIKAVDAKLIYFLSQADYRAALGQDQLP